MALGIGFGTTLTVGGTVIGGIVDQIDNEVSREEVDTTLLGDLYKTSSPADIDPGELTFDVALGGDGDSALVALFTSGDEASWTITYSNGGADTFSGWVKSLGRTVSKREMLTRKVTVKLSGNPGV